MISYLKSTGKWYAGNDVMYAENKQRWISNVAVEKSTVKWNVLWRHVRGKQVTLQVIFVLQSLICSHRFHCSESKHHNSIVMAYEVRILIILLYFQNLHSRTNIGKSANRERRKFWFERIIRNNEKRYGIYGRNVSWIVKRYGKYGRKESWIVIRFGKYGRKISWKVKR